MTPFTTLTALACPLGIDNIDTDQLIPARFMRRPRSQGYGDVLLHDLRRDGAGRIHGGFPLDLPRWQGARILIAGRNFGGGSSREAAVYALVDHGIGCVIAPGFGDIFMGNAVNNGLLPVTLAEDDCRELAGLVEAGDGVVTVDLPACQIRAGGTVLDFGIDPLWRVKLLNGWDDIGLTASHAEDIAAFVRQDRVLRPWALARPQQEG